MAEDPKTTPKAAKAESEDWGQAELQAADDKAKEQGYVGTVPDETPNENYSLQTPPSAPTPETERVHPSKAQRADGAKGK